MTLNAPHKRRNYAKIPDVLEVPSLVHIQLDSFRWFQEKGLRELLNEVSPIQDFTGRRMELRFIDYYIWPLTEEREDLTEAEKKKYHPKYSEKECRERDVTYSSPLYVRVQVLNKESGELKEQDLFMGEFPLMTPNGTFVINGAERVVVSQLVRSPGAYFTMEQDISSGRELCFCKLIPDRGAWLEFETSSKDVISVKVDGKRKIPITTLLRAIGCASSGELEELFMDVDTSPEHHYTRATMERDPLVTKEEEALTAFYRRLRPGDPPTIENATTLIQNLFFNPHRYDLGRVGRYQLNKRLGLENSPNQRVLTKEDIIEITRHIIMVNNGADTPDDIDHLGNRRARTVGELIYNQFRIGLLRLERVVRERMSITDPDVATPSTLINILPVVAAIREFFGSSQLSQFMDQTNPLAELTHKRRLSSLGPGGLSRERAGFEVRDVHHSHYGRICPIETPEGPNIGLIGSLATYSQVNEYGFLEAPYRMVVRELESNSPELVGRATREGISDDEGNAILEAGEVVSEEAMERLSAVGPRRVRVKPFISNQIVYLSADKEEQYTIAQADAKLDERGQFIQERVDAREGDRFYKETPDRIDLMDVSPKQIVSVAASLIPFLEHDDANRALMGTNMQRQAVPLLRPDAPLVGTGMEGRVAKDSGQVIFSEGDGEVVSTSGHEIIVRDSEGEHHYPLMKFRRTNQGNCLNQRPIVEKGDLVRQGQVLADSSSTEGGELSLGQNVLCAFMSWEGYNYEDAIIISEDLVMWDKFTSIHIEKHEVEARDTKLGPEEITRDIPNVGEESLRDLDEDGIIRTGAEVGPGDILVGKITPKGETELTAEEKLLRAIFGEKAREVKDTSLRVPHGERGKVIAVRVSSRDSGDDLHTGVNKLVRVWVAQIRKVAEGDKMAGRHGNKGVVSCILPRRDMPFLPDGTPVDIILNPLGVPSRMNIGQVFETHLGWAAHTLGFKAITPVFDGADDKAIEGALSQAWILQRSGAKFHDGAVDRDEVRGWLDERGYEYERIFADEGNDEAKRACLRLWLEDIGVEARLISDDDIEREAERVLRETLSPPPTFGKMMLRDGRSGEPFDRPVTVGYIYMMKLIHLVEDKIHARSTGPYSLITQQPLGGKAQFGGQRFGEMEVWALEAYGVAHILQELLTVKSDDVPGRAQTYEAIVKGEDITAAGVPESFKVLVKELQSLGLEVEVLSEEAKPPSDKVPDRDKWLLGPEEEE